MSLFIIWLGVMLPLVFSPGPANIVFAASGARVGVKRSIPLVAGVDTVFFIKSIIIGFGLGEVVRNHPEVMNSLQLLGAVYLVYVAAKFLRPHTDTLAGSSQSLGFADGVLIQLLNSKGWLLVLLMFTLFTEQSQDVFGDQGVAVLIVWLALLNITMHFVWVSMGELLARVSSSPLYEKWLNLFYAGSLIAVSLWLVIENPMVRAVFTG